VQVGTQQMIVCGYNNKKNKASLAIYVLPEVNTKALSLDDCHDSEITGIEVVTDPFNIFTSSRDGFIRMWSLNQSNSLELTSTGMAGNSIECLKITPSALVAGCSDGNLKLFKWSQVKKQWENVHTIEAHTGTVASITTVGPLIYSVGGDGACSILLLSDTELSLIAKLGLNGPASANGYFEAGKIIPVGLQDGQIQFFKKEGFIQSGAFKKGNKAIKKIIVTDSHNLICDIGGGVTIWTILDPEKAEIRKEKLIAAQQASYQGGGGYQQNQDNHSMNFQ